MIMRRFTVGLLSVLVLGGCTSHLVFYEEDSLGLKAKFESSNPAPAQLSLGYRRGIVAVIPQKSDGKKPSAALAVTTTEGQGKKTITITDDPNELMSLYTLFKANVGFMDPVETKHFLATGTAAASLLANDDNLRDVTKAFEGSDSKKEANQ